ncbi:hypothetical protein D9M68_464510 [compost metagenome]
MHAQVEQAGKGGGHPAGYVANVPGAGGDHRHCHEVLHDSADLPMFASLCQGLVDDRVLPAADHDMWPLQVQRKREAAFAEPLRFPDHRGQADFIEHFMRDPHSPDRLGADDGVKIAGFQ